MKHHPFLAAAFAVLLAGCASGETSVYDAQFGLGFSYPSEWGEWTEPLSFSQSGALGVSERTFSILDANMRFPKEDNATVDATFRTYDDAAYRYEEVCDSIIDLCDRTRQQDLLEEKADFEKNATQTIGGVPAVITEGYDVPSGYLYRDVRFYTPTHRVRLSAIYDIGAFLVAQQPSQESLVETARRILGDDLNDPINRLQTMYPNDMKDMGAFFNDVDGFLKSITVDR